MQRQEEEPKYEIVEVVLAHSSKINGMHIAILKRNNNTYSRVKHQNNEFVLGAGKLSKKMIAKLAWFDENEYEQMIKEIEIIKVKEQRVLELNEQINQLDKEQKKKEKLKPLQEKIIGTKWYVSQPNTTIKDKIFEFCQNGVLKHDDKVSKWDIKDQQIIISHNDGYAILTGQITDDVISGTALNIKGKKWTFSGKQILKTDNSYISEKQQEDFTNDQTFKKENQKQALNALLVKKTNWVEFQQVLQQNDVITLYHFTDRANIASIKKYGGLYSWDYCDKNDIIIPYQGGGSLSRDLDRKYSLQDYVRVSFTRNHPMMFVAQNEGRIQNPVILTISLDVCYFQETRFANMNATKTGHKQGKNLENLQSVHFNTVKQINHFDLDELEKPYFQAEVLVKTWIPIKYITNINNF